MKELIDFDGQFNEYLEQWSEEMLKKGKKPEEIESEMPRIYEEWAKEAQKYFEELSAEELVKMLGAYMDEECGVPDILTEKIALTAACEQLVFDMLREERSENDKIVLMNILADMGSSLPAEEYIRIVRRNDDEQMSDAAAEALKYMHGAEDRILQACDEEDDPAVKEKLMYALVYSEPKVKGLAQRLNALMEESPRKAVVAGLMSYYGDEKCLDALKKAENDRNIDYIDYVEICDAIEALGGETARDREFNGDGYYEMVQNGGLE